MTRICPSISQLSHPIRNAHSSCRPQIQFLSFTPRHTFSTTTVRYDRKPTRNERRLNARHLSVPKYPYGPARVFKRADRGLYGGLRIKFGNIVNKTGLITTKARRSWKPNIHRKRLYSEALDQLWSVRVSTRVLRTIDKVGGLDNYILGDKTARIKELGMFGWKLRWMIMQKQQTRERLQTQRRALGLPEDQPKRKEMVLSLLKNSTSNLPKNGEERHQRHIQKWKMRQRRDVWQGSMISDLLREQARQATASGDLSSHSRLIQQANELRILHRQHKESVSKMRTEQKNRKDYLKMMPKTSSLKDPSASTLP